MGGSKAGRAESGPDGRSPCRTGGREAGSLPYFSLTIRKNDSAAIPQSRKAAEEKS